MKTLNKIEKILTEYKAKLKREYKIREIGIFGSFVRGEQKKTSDFDILVEFDEVPDLLKFIELERFLEELLKIKVDLVRKQAIRKELKERILKEVINI
jgi:predicted nucleotidyltransferase